MKRVTQRTFLQIFVNLYLQVCRFAQPRRWSLRLYGILPATAGSTLVGIRWAGEPLSKLNIFVSGTGRPEVFSSSNQHMLVLRLVSFGDTPELLLFTKHLTFASCRASSHGAITYYISSCTSTRCFISCRPSRPPRAQLKEFCLRFSSLQLTYRKKSAKKEI